MSGPPPVDRGGAPPGAPRFVFRPLAGSDLPLLAEWRGRPHLAEWGGAGASPEAIREEYLPAAPGPAGARPFLAFLDGRPVGYIQVYDASAGDPAWWPDHPGPGVRGIDQFLADPARLGRGLGTAMVRQFAAQVFEDPRVTEIRLDPRTENLRAVRCYRKAGFREVGPIVTPDGPAVLMVLDRAAFEGPG